MLHLIGLGASFKLLTIFSVKSCKMADLNSRKKNFPFDETNTLVAEVKKYKETLFRKLRPSLTTDEKKRTWESVAVKVTACGVARRSSQDVQIEYKNFKSPTKTKYNKFQRAVNQTGGGTPPRQEDSINKLESEVVDIYAGTPSFDGLRGFDSGQTQGMQVFLLFVF